MEKLNMGTIVSWEAPKEIAFVALQNATISAGFDEKYAREMLPRNAFTRAARDLSDDRVIRRVDESDDEIEFQFTREYLAANIFNYEMECKLWLNKETGSIRIDDPAFEELAEEARKLVLEHQAKRNQGDITKMIQRIFGDRKGDLVPLRHNGGVYFVPDTHKDLVESVYKLMIAIGGRLNRYVISFGDANTTTSVAQAMTDYLHDQIDQLRESCKGLSSETSATVLSRRNDVVLGLRDKLHSYQALLAGYADAIADEIDKAENEIVQAVMNSGTVDSAELAAV